MAKDSEKSYSEAIDEALGQRAESAGKARICSFCGADEGEVAKLIAGPKAFICNDCVSRCVSILDRLGIDA